MATPAYDFELDGLVSLPKLPWQGELPAAQRRALLTLDTACTTSLMALERKGLVQWSGCHWFRTPFGQHVASALEQPLVTEVVKGPTLPKLTKHQREALLVVLDLGVTTPFGPQWSSFDAARRALDALVDKGLCTRIFDCRGLRYALATHAPKECRHA